MVRSVAARPALPALWWKGAKLNFATLLMLLERREFEITKVVQAFVEPFRKLKTRQWQKGFKGELRPSKRRATSLLQSLSHVVSEVLGAKKRSADYHDAS